MADSSDVAGSPITISRDMNSEPGWSNDMAETAWDDITVEHSGSVSDLPIDAGRVIIRDANMRIQAEDASGLYRSLVAFNKDLGGFEFSSFMQNTDGHVSVSAVFKVPPARLDAFMDFAGDNGMIITSRVDSRDVTDEYYDMAARVEIKRSTLESYYGMLERAETFAEIVSMQRTIDGIIEEIEAFEGRLRLLGSLADMATVTVHIEQIIEEDEEEEAIERREIDWGSLSADDVGYFIRNGFIAVVNFFLMVFQWMLIALTVTSPIWIPAGAIGLAVRRRRKRRAEKQKDE